LALGLAAAQDSSPDDYSSDEIVEGSLLVDFDFERSDLENQPQKLSENEKSKDQPEQTFGTLEDTFNPLVKKIYGSYFEKKKAEEAAKLAKLHKEREALEAELAVKLQQELRGGGRMFGGGGRFGGRLGFGGPALGPASGPLTGPPDRTTSPPKPKRNRSRATTTTSTTTTTTTTTTTKATTKATTTKKITTTRRPQSTQPIQKSENQRCHVCKDANSEAECRKNGQVEECGPGQSCQMEFRWQNGQVKIEATCKQATACWVAMKQNKNCKQLKGLTGVNRTCWKCCRGDLCNLAALDPSKV